MKITFDLPEHKILMIRRILLKLPQKKVAKIIKSSAPELCRFEAGTTIYSEKRVDKLRKLYDREEAKRNA